LKLLNFNSFDTLGNLEEISKEMNVIITPENLRSANEYFLIACADFEAFKKLYLDDPAFGIYHLEQFHEKLINSFLLLSGRFESKDLENHNKAVVKINDFVKKTKLFSRYINIYNDIENKNIGANIKSIINEKSISINPTEKEISALLLFLNNIRDKCTDEIFIAKLIKKNTKGQKLIFIQKLLIKWFNISAKKKEVKYVFSDKLVRDTLFFNYLNYNIILLYLLFLPHFSNPRYRRGDINYFTYKTMDLTKKLNEIKEIDEILLTNYKIYLMQKSIV
jgi:hypothetical protein